MGIRILKGNRPATGTDKRKAVEIPVEVEHKGAAAIAAYVKSPPKTATIIDDPPRSKPRAAPTEADNGGEEE